MVNRANPIQGRSIDRHPFSDQQAELGVYIKGASVIAAQAQVPGVVQTPEGDMTFQAGDFIVTDNPPTHAWPVRQQVFETTYVLEHMLEPGQYPTTEPVEKVDPALSVPPTNVTQLKAEEIGQEPPPAGQTDVQADKAAALASNPIEDAEELKVGERGPEDFITADPTPEPVDTTSAGSDTPAASKEAASKPSSLPTGPDNAPKAPKSAQKAK